MCNLYSITKGQVAIIEFARAVRDLTGNLPPMPGVFPDYSAPIVRNAPDGARELTKARWGMPSSQFAQMEGTKKRAAKLEARGQAVDFKELLRMEPVAGPPTFATRAASIGSDGLALKTVTLSTSPPSVNSQG